MQFIMLKFRVAVFNSFREKTLTLFPAPDNTRPALLSEFHHQLILSQRTQQTTQKCQQTSLYASLTKETKKVIFVHEV